MIQSGINADVINQCCTLSDIECLRYLQNNKVSGLNEFSSVGQIQESALTNINATLEAAGLKPINMEQLSDYAKIGAYGFKPDVCLDRWRMYGELDSTTRNRLGIENASDFLEKFRDIANLQTNGISLKNSVLHNDNGEQSRFIVSEEAKEYASNLEKYKWNIATDAQYTKYTIELMKHGYQIEEFLAQTLIIDGQSTTVGKYLYSRGGEYNTSKGANTVIKPSITKILTEDGRLRSDAEIGREYSEITKHDIYTVIANAIEDRSAIGVGNGNKSEFRAKIQSFFNKQSDFKTLALTLEYYNKNGIGTHAAAASIARNNTMIYSTRLNGKICSMTLEQIAKSYDIFNANKSLGNGFNYRKQNKKDGLTVEITSETGVYMGKFIFDSDGNLITVNN